MAVDKSLKIKGTLLRRRNVLSREERILRLEREERWEAGQSVFGLPKVSTRGRKARSKKKKAEQPQVAEQTATDTEEPTGGQPEKTAAP